MRRQGIRAPMLNRHFRRAHQTAAAKRPMKKSRRIKNVPICLLEMCARTVGRLLQPKRILTTRPGLGAPVELHDRFRASQAMLNAQSTSMTALLAKGRWRFRAIRLVKAAGAPMRDRRKKRFHHAATESCNQTSIKIKNSYTLR